MSTTDPSFTWGADTAGRLERTRRRSRGTTRTRGILRLRMEAIIIDGLLTLVPILAITYLFSLAFPHDGFFIVKSSSGRAGLTMGTPGLLMTTALSLGYFFGTEALFGRTIGKRKVGLRVRSASGGPAGLNAISARTVLRLLDGLGFYLLGALVCLLTGSRRRRIGDWAGGTVVVRDDGSLGRPTRRAWWRVVAYPTMWLAAVLVGVFALGLGTAAGESEGALALVQSYLKARQQGNAHLACSMLTRAQQQELVALQGGGYAGASASRCPAYILSSVRDSHLLNPALSELAGLPLATSYSPLGAVVVYSPELRGLELTVVSEDGHLKLDVRGLERLEFIRACSSTSLKSSTECTCIFDSARAQGSLPDGPPTARVVSALRNDAARCRRIAS